MTVVVSKLPLKISQLLNIAKSCGITVTFIKVKWRKYYKLIYRKALFAPSDLTNVVDWTDLYFMNKSKFFYFKKIKSLKKSYYFKKVNNK